MENCVGTQFFITGHRSCGHARVHRLLINFVVLSSEVLKGPLEDMMRQAFCITSRVNYNGALIVLNSYGVPNVPVMLLGI